MTNLFSIFDLLTISNLSLNWFSTVLFLMFLPQIFWLSSNKYMTLWNLMIKFIFKEMKISLNPFNFFNIIILITLFTFITLNNFISLFPYIFNSSSHMTFSFSFSLMFWFSFILFSWLKNLNNTLIHLTPQGTPPILMPFMVLIELISNMIRPLTLAIRLSANIIAGHLLLTLMSQSGPSLNIILTILLISSQSILMILEIAVSFIQSYVFSILSTLYFTETN